MLDNITSLFDNYKGKIRNPFIGTIISVWLIHNWRIPFALFNFDDDCTMQDKINYIADYFGKQDFWSELGEIIFYSFLILVFTFLLMAISRFLTDSYYIIIEKTLITFIDKNAVYSKEDKILLDERILELENLLNSKREEITRTETNNSYMKINRDKIQSDFDSYVKSKTEELQHLQRKMDELVSKYKLSEKVINLYDDLIVTLSPEEKNAIQYVVNQHKNYNGITISDTMIKIFDKYGFIDSTGVINTLNPMGAIFIEYYRDFYLSVKI